ncbi:peroxide stress protein YaaA [Halomonas sp. McH1-25]|uniref:peroxide stress protein YaaA n=1 Tax=unclassified Halomonas TaxID=2609666 RepID=UPI001EF6CFEF|nr:MULTISPECIES: peroxide stress protein YaaA [unclassified Halomonas]MCG7601733.1 peroxide stress protein YaaA [Halomonas sp. McH1-25]MCP1344560.1 peroxide stress protein YaaA [Halomonas sp. FL8]MCP1360710.1 peroxide stress protein YaaA [Halomonas sp. BBD45]MCP1364997.1 peroxide stress protein YaaA [Halomonas sp. BBD48]
MLSVISPAKTLDFDTPPTTSTHTQPDYLPQSQALIDILRDYSPQRIAELMGISDKLAGLNAARFAEWAPPFDLENAKQAVQAFQGDVYVGLNAASFSEADNTFAQDHLRILSGLYGLLRPLDLIQPYRLEMGTRLPNDAGKDLYAFWKARLTQDLDAAVVHSGTPVLVNLASNEYFKAIDTKRLSSRVVTPVFKDAKNGQYKIISFYAKKARGLMAAWMIQQRVDDPEGLKEFDIDGYRFNPTLSQGDTWVFTRKEQNPS